ncbi:MAG: ACP S-malonyltransferase [Candidatus Izemoplasmatales bacterium]
MSKIAILFPGQGAQSIGMGKSFYESSETARAVYKKASDYLKVDIEKICFEENDLINQTIYTQKAIFVTSTAIYETLKEKYPIQIDGILGFSLGEYSAMYASGIFSFEEMLSLIEHRATWMEECASKHPGLMGALIGGDAHLIEQFASETTKNIGLLQIANYNSPSQKVLSGVPEAFEHLQNHLLELGIKRLIMLNVSGAFHSPLMEEAALKMKQLVSTLDFKKPKINIVMNATAAYLKINELPELVYKQLSGPVRFEESIRYLIQEGFDTFIEVGPGKVLSGLVKKIDDRVKVKSITEYNDFVNMEELL